MKAPKSPYTLKTLQELVYEEQATAENMSGLAIVFRGRFSDGIKGHHVNPVGSEKVYYAENNSQLNKILKSL